MIIEGVHIFWGGLYGWPYGILYLVGTVPPDFMNSYKLEITFAGDRNTATAFLSAISAKIYLNAPRSLTSSDSCLINDIDF